MQNIYQIVLTKNIALDFACLSDNAGFRQMRHSWIDKRLAIYGSFPNLSEQSIFQKWKSYIA
jgi:hypothetical protein